MINQKSKSINLHLKRDLETYGVIESIGHLEEDELIDML